MIFKKNEKGRKENIRNCIYHKLFNKNDSYVEIFGKVYGTIRFTLFLSLALYRKARKKGGKKMMKDNAKMGSKWAFHWLVGGPTGAARLSCRFSPPAFFTSPSCLRLELGVFIVFFSIHCAHILFDLFILFFVFVSFSFSFYYLSYTLAIP